MVELRRKLREALWEMRSEWYHLGIELNIPEGTLKVNIAGYLSIII